MAEPLLCTDRPPQFSCSCSRSGEDQRNDEYDRCNDTSRGGQSTRLSKTDSSLPSSPESLTSFSFFLRPKFFVAGFLFGALLESFYVQAIRLGLITVENHTTDDGRDYTIQVLTTWTDVFFYELSFMCCDVVFLLYLLILIWHAIKKNLSINLPINAANWTQGMVLGLSVTVVSLIGPKVVLQQRIWQVLWSVVVGNALCFVSYDAVLEMHCMMTSQERPSFCCCASSSSSSCRGGKTEQETSQRQHDHGVHHDPNTMPSFLIEAHIV